MTDDPFPRLQAIAEYRTGRIELLRYSLFTLTLGGLLTARTVLVGHDPVEALLFGGLGGVCVVIGWVNYRYVIPTALLVEAAYLGLAGAGFVGFAALVWAAARVERGWMFEFWMVGGLMLGWAAFAVVRARRAAALLPGRPTAEEVAWLETIVDEVWAGDPSAGAGAVAFTTQEFGNTVYAWRGRFYGGAAVFVKRPGGGLLVARRPDVSVVDGGRVWLGREHRMRLRIGGRRLRATVGQSRWRTSRSGGGRPTSRADSPRRPDVPRVERCRRRTSRIRGTGARGGGVTRALGFAGTTQAVRLCQHDRPREKGGHLAAEEPVARNGYSLTPTPNSRTPPRRVP